MILKTCTECNKQKPIYKNVTDEHGVRHRYCTQCYGLNNKPKQIKKVSTKQTEKNKEYTIKRLKYLTENPMCQAALPGCNKFATDVHHVEGRGINTTNEETFKALCRFCHSMIHTQLSREERNNLGL
jgi:hypothetical protein